jgi:hypothetical protein
MVQVVSYQHNIGIFAMPLIVSGAGCSPPLFAVSHIRAKHISGIAASPGSNRSKTTYTHIQLSDVEKRARQREQSSQGLIACCRLRD